MESTKLQSAVFTELPELPWAIMSAILYSRAGSNFIRREAIPLCCVNNVKTMRPNQVQSAADTPPQETGSIQFLIQLELKIAMSGFLVVENLVVDMLLGMAPINTNIKSMYPKRE